MAKARRRKDTQFETSMTKSVFLYGNPNNGKFELPHPTDVGWGFHGLAPVKPRQSSYGYSNMTLQLLILRIKATGLYQRKSPDIPVRPYTCRIILLIRTRGLSEEKLFMVRIPGRLTSYIFMSINICLDQCRSKLIIMRCPALHLCSNGA